MTLGEAKALVLREGLAGKDTPEDAGFVLLHYGDVPNSESMGSLLRALRLLFEGLQEETVLERPLAAALWSLGNSANDCLFNHQQDERPWLDGEQDDVLELILTIESVFYGIRS